jgi:hypothetical protein
LLGEPATIERKGERYVIPSKLFITASRRS